MKVLLEVPVVFVVAIALGIVFAGVSFLVMRPALVDDNVRWVAPKLVGADALARLGEKANHLALETTSEPILRQVDVNPARGKVFFHFTDAQATFEIQASFPSPSGRSDNWQVSRPDVSMLVGDVRPGLELQALGVGPADALGPMTSHWPDCAPRALTLVGQHDTLTWQTFCTLPDGRVASGTINGQTGAFQPSPAPPALPPSVTTAAPSR